jgi:hypothetical protein
MTLVSRGPACLSHEQSLRQAIFVSGTFVLIPRFLLVVQCFIGDRLRLMQSELFHNKIELPLLELLAMLLAKAQRSGILLLTRNKRNKTSVYCECLALSNSLPHVTAKARGRNDLAMWGLATHKVRQRLYHPPAMLSTRYISQASESCWPVVPTYIYHDHDSWEGSVYRSSQG